MRNTENILNELNRIKQDIRAIRVITMSDQRNQWISHARVILNDTLVHLPEGELKRQVYTLLGDSCL